MSSYADFSPAILVIPERVSLDIRYGSSNGDDIELQMKSKEGVNVMDVATHCPLPPSTSTIFTIPVTSPSETPALSGSQNEINRNTSELAPVDRGFGAWSFVSLTPRPGPTDH